MSKILKKVCILLLCLLLNACSVYESDDDLYTKVEDTLFSLSKSTFFSKPNMNKTYYDYYLPFDMKNIKSSQLSEIFRCGNEILILNFRTISMIKNTYYTDSDKTDVVVDQYTEEELQEMMKNDSVDLEYTSKEELEGTKVELDYTVKRSLLDEGIFFKGIYLAKNDAIYSYTLSLLKDKNMCYMYLDGDIATFISYIPIAECEDMLYRMFHIMKSIEYDEQRIIKDYKLLYSLLKMEEDDNKNEIYDESIPDKGYLEDLIQRQED